MNLNCTIDLIVPEKNDCEYTSYYCEENIWHLAKWMLENNKLISDLKCYVIFISNSKKCIHLWKQNNVQNEEDPIFWDYHVILVTQTKDKTLIFDLNSTLPFPVSFSRYIKEAVNVDPNDIQFKRIVEADKYLKLFSSDRRHMFKDNHWTSPPPTYPPILNEDKIHNLDSFISMDSSNKFGEVFNLEQFTTKFS